MSLDRVSARRDLRHMWPVLRQTTRAAPRLTLITTNDRESIGSVLGPLFRASDVSTQKRMARRLRPLGHRGRDSRRSGWGSERQSRRSSTRAAGAHSHRPIPRRRDCGASATVVRAHVLDCIPGGDHGRRVRHQSRTRRDVRSVFRVDGVLDSIKASEAHVRSPDRSRVRRAARITEPQKRVKRWLRLQWCVIRLQRSSMEHSKRPA